MSILIKGIDMPENCYKCKFALARFDPLPTQKYKRHDFECVLTEKTLTATKRNRACPLVPVPAPHGRLADADALKERIAATYYSQDEKDKAPMDDIPWMNGCNTKVKEVCWMIDDAPTVMEAEEGEG